MFPDWEVCYSKLATILKQVRVMKKPLTLAWAHDTFEVMTAATPGHLQLVMCLGGSNGPVCFFTSMCKFCPLLVY